MGFTKLENGCSRDVADRDGTATGQKLFHDRTADAGAPAALITARPDATLAELREALPTRAALSTLWLEIDRLGLTVKKNRTRRRTATP